MAVMEKVPISRRTWLILLVGFASLVFLLLRAFIDEAPSEKNLALQADFLSGTPSPAFIYLYGLDAPADVAPDVLGAQRVADPSSAPIPGAGGLALPEGPLFCASHDDRDCIRSLFGASGIAPLLAQHDVLLQRGKVFLHFTEYQTQTRPSLEEPFPPFHYLSRAYRLMLLEGIAQYQQGQAQQALSLLAERFRQARALYARQDSLVGRLVLNNLLLDNLAVQSLILGQGDAVTAAPIESPGIAEISLRTVFAREFEGMRAMFTGLSEQPGLWSERTSVSPVLRRFLFKPNTTANALALDYRTLIGLSEQSPRAFARSVAQPLFERPRTSLRNIVGSRLRVALEPEAFIDYVGRVQALAVHIDLFNRLYHERQSPAALSNPYAPDETVYLDDGSVCVNAPVEMPASFSCLPVAREFAVGLQ